jgi:hypothetical protein
MTGTVASKCPGSCCSPAKTHKSLAAGLDTSATHEHPAQVKGTDFGPGTVQTVAVETGSGGQP